MDNNGGHLDKRQRTVGPEPWSDHNRRPPPPPPQDHHRLPAISAFQQQRPGSPFSRPVALEPPHASSNSLGARRNSEHGHVQYEQDPRRSNSGPHPGQYPHPHPNSLPPASTPNNHASPFSRPQETMIKRDPGDDLQAQYRPASNGQDQISHMERHQQHFEATPQYRAPPPYHQAPQPQPPPTPMSASESYGQPYGPPGAAAGYSVSYPSSAANANAVKRKAQRAAQACDSCRSLKAKCDEGRPGCSSCRDKGITCAYRDPPPKQYVPSRKQILPN
jgi:hypothetical protein